MEARLPARPVENPEWRILVIDDDEEDYIIAREMLKAAKGRKFDVHWASTYAAGKKEILSDHYHAVLVDYDLGLHSGVELIREANAWNYAAPFILFTGRGNYEVDVEAMEAGATLYLTKSEANPLLLERAIRYAIELKHKEQTLRESEAHLLESEARLRASEAALRQSEAKEREKLAELTAVLDATPAIVWITHDPQAEEVTGNQAAHDFLRVPPGKELPQSAPMVAPRNFRVFRDGQEVTPPEQPLQFTAATGQPIRNLEEEIVFEDGERAYLLGNVTPLLDDDGKPCGAVAAFINITERKQAEDELLIRESTLHRLETRWNAAIESIDVGVIIATEDEQVIYWNPAARQMHGFLTPEEGIEPLEQTPITFQLWTPDGSHLLELDEWPMRRIKRGEPVRNMELRIRRPDQGWEKIFSYSGTMVDTMGGERLIFLTCQDLTGQRRVEAALREGEERLRFALDAAHMVAWEYDPATLKVTLSENAEEALELPRAHENSDEGYGMIHPEDVEKHRALVTRAIETGGSYVSVYRHTHPHKVIWLEEHGQAVLDPADRTLRLVGVVQNITERVQSEQELRESESRLRAFVESTRSNYIALDRQWRFTYVNRHYSEVMGRRPEDLIGKTYWDLFPHYLGTELERNYRRVMEEGTPLHYRQGGVYTASQFDVSVYPTQEGLAVFSIDRTEELRYQQQLENERARLAAVLEALPVGVWMTDAEGRIVGKNAQSDRIWAGEAPMAAGVEQYQEYRSWDAQTGKELQGEDFPLSRALHTGRLVEPEEHRIQRFDGSQGFVLVSAVPIKDGEGRLTGAVAINVDITGRKQSEQALKQAEEKFSKAFLYNPVALTITRISDGRYLEVNEAFYQLTGYTQAEIIGNTVHDISLYVEPGKRAEMVERVLLEGRLRNYEIKIRTKDGAVRTILTSIDPINIAGEIYLLTTFIDITERIETEQALRDSESALRQSEAMLRDFLENSQESFFILDRDWHFQFINRNFSEILHTSLEALAGKTFWQAFPNYVSTPVEQNYRKVMEERVPVSFEMGGMYSPNWFDISVYPTQEGIGVFAIDRTEEKQAREALLESQARLKRAQQIAHLGSWELDLISNRLAWSDEVYRIFGLQPQEFAATYEGFLERVHPDDRAAVQETYEGSVKENLDGFEMEHRVIRALTGEVRYVHEKCEHLRDASGQIIRSVGMIHDITERKQAEMDLQERNEALRASEAVLEAFFANSPGILSIEDENFRYIKTDPLTPTYYGLDRQSILGRAVKDLAPEFFEQFGPMLRRVIETGQAESREVYSPVPDRPGEMTYWQASYFPVPLPGGKRGVGVMGVEITGQKKTEQALELERAKLAAAIEEIPVGVCIGDALGNVLSLNNAGLKLHEFASEAEMFSQVENYLKEFELRNLDGSPLPVEEWPSSKALQGVFVQNHEVILHNLRTGKDRIVAYSAAPVKNNNGDTLLIVYTLQDLTESKEAELSLQHYAQELERSNQALQEFAFIASHDLQEPLRKIVMFGNSLSRLLCDTADESAQDYLERMRSAAERMQTMIQGLLELSRISTRGENISTVHLDQLVVEVISDLEAQVEAVNGQVVVSELPSLQADELQMRQLFQNMISNALKFHKPDQPPIVRISGTLQKKAQMPVAEIRIEDNGIGFEQEYADRIFQPFQRLHGRSEYEGTGLGLAICKKIVERHHGTIEVESAPGVGTTFVIRLPAKITTS